MSDSSPKRRRWFQFSLRTLFVVVTVVGVVSGWVAYQRDWIRQRREYVKQKHETFWVTKTDEYEAGPFTPGVRAPGLLWLFGEKAAAIVSLHFVDEKRATDRTWSIDILDIHDWHFDDRRKLFTSQEIEEARRAQRLFPEAWICGDLEEPRPLD